ncbi:hypothetical protein [Streptomyces sp. NPDC091371]|uniref:hypothetical protein n=1 Tax=Streptomyces sp. NPDC091371 TaxID=3155303 RepID=UPI00343514A1
MTAETVLVLPAVETPAGDARFEEIVGALDPKFLEMLGWCWERRVITFPRVYPVIGLADRPVPNCPLAITVFTHQCAGAA